jgi:hypothetical protein
MTNLLVMLILIIDYKNLTLAAGTDRNISLEGNCLRR